MADNDCFADYHDWLAAGMALRAHFGDEPGFPLWQITNNGTCSADAEAAKWQTFSTEPSADGVDIGTLRRMANTAKCPHTIGTSTASMFAGVAQLAAAVGASGMSAVPNLASPPIAPDMPTQLSADERAKATADALDALPDMFRNSGEFTDGFVPPDYLVDTILQRGFLYSFTAQTGVGKTTVAMRLAAHVATEKPFCGHDVQRGTVLYFAGENPTDIQMRWLGLTKEMGIDPKTVDVHFTYGPNKLLPEVIARIMREVARKSLTLAAIIIDTAAAHFTGDLENHNDQNGKLRAATALALHVTRRPMRRCALSSDKRRANH
jgi:AAA domain/Primase C terminal 2 (PriCT-2)